MIKRTPYFGNPAYLKTKDEKSIDGVMIKECCFKLKVDRLGNIKPA